MNASQREHDEFMREEALAEERAYRRAGLPSPFRPGVVRPMQYPARPPAAPATSKPARQVTP